MGEAIVEELWDELSGLEFLRAVIDGRAPLGRQQHHLGLRISSAEPGRVGLGWAPGAALRNNNGGVHGGYIAMVLDETSCCAALSLRERCGPVSTQSLSIDYFAPLQPGRDYRAVGEIAHAGRRRMVANARILAADSTPVAQATATVLPTS